VLVPLLPIQHLMRHLHHPQNQYTILSQYMNPSHTIMLMVFKMNMLELALRLQKTLMERQSQVTTQFNFQTEEDKMLSIQPIIMLDMSPMYRMRAML